MVMSAAEDTGTGWPDPTEPGVPAAPLVPGFHWMRWPGGGAWTMGEWCPSQWGWTISYHPELVDPGDLAHLDYKGRAMPPADDGNG